MNKAINRRQFLTRAALAPVMLSSSSALVSLFNSPSANALYFGDEFPFTHAERDRRWNNVRQLLSKQGFDALILPHRSGDDVNQLMYATYLSGGGFFEFGDGAVVFPLKGDPVLVGGMVPAHWISQRADKHHDKSGTQISLGQRIVDTVNELDLARAKIAVVGTEASSDGINEFMNEGLITYGAWSKVLKGLPRAKFTDITEDFSLLMMVKSDEEIAGIKKSALLGESLNKLMLEETHIGMHRNEFRAMVEEFLILNNARADVHALQMKPGRVAQGDVINSEYGIIYAGGYSQVTLCMAVGAMSSEMQALADTAHESMEYGAANLRAGKKFGDVIEAMENIIHGAGYWHVVPNIHNVLPMTLVGPVYTGGPDAEGTKCLGADVEVKAGMAFSFEPSALNRTGGQAKVGVTAVVTEKGIDIYNKLGRTVQVI